MKTIMIEYYYSSQLVGILMCDKLPMGGYLCTKEYFVQTIGM